MAPPGTGKQDLPEEAPPVQEGNGRAGGPTDLPDQDVRHDAASVPPHKDHPGQDDLFDEDLIHRVAPIFKLLRLYSRLEVEGVERIPDGGAILAANHTGWIGLDYAYTALSVYDTRKRVVRGMAHPTWFRKSDIASMAARLGLFEVNKDTMRALLRAGEIVLIFPEGEKGAFKPERERYILQEFARGHIRVALESGVPIVPVAIVGGEEANPSSGRIDSYEDLLHLSLPMPQNLFPRPVKWRIRFLEPVYLEGGPERAADSGYVHKVNEEIKMHIQTEVGRLLSLRGHPFL